MRELGGKRVRIHQALFAGAACIALAAPLAAFAEPLAPAPQDREAQVDLNISSGDLSSALNQLGRQAKVQIAFLPGRVRGRHVKALRGSMTVDEALARLLDGTGLRIARTARGSYIVGGPTAGAMKEAQNKVDDISAAHGLSSTGKEEVPEILIIGKRQWTLNLDIKRTANDAQPYQVFTHDDIARSGTSSLEDFFKYYLNANNSGSTSTQVGNSGQSFINLRGLGSGSTLILVDGRRFAEANTGDGAFGQSSVNGIPLDAIERIEVLPSSASGIYGSNAVAGVINIIMRRDYSGFEATAYYGNTTRLDAFENRLSLNGNFPLEGGKTRVSFTTSWQKTGPLYTGDRDFVERGRELLDENAPSYFNTIGLPVFSTTPNIVNSTGANLILKKALGGTNLGSRITYVPLGYRGVALDGVAALLANAGKQNLELSPTVSAGTAGNGSRSLLLTPTQSYNGSLTVRREFNKWLSVYAEGSYGRYEALNITNQSSGTYRLPAASPENPFTTDIQVSVPVAVGNRWTKNVSTNWRALAGAIVKLPYDWQADIDLSWNWNTFQANSAPPTFDKATNAALQAGTLGFLRGDILSSPPNFTYLDNPSNGVIGSPHSTARSYTLKMAGPLPLLRLWGGKPIVTLLLEQDRQNQGEYRSFTNNATNSTISFTPPRSQRTDSAYGEVRFPIIAARNKIPFIHELELQVAARWDRYTGVGANAALACFPTSGTFANPLPDNAYSAPCPASGVQPVYATTRNSSTNPTVAARWAVTRDIAFRGSYSTGYQPPSLNQLVGQPAGTPGNPLSGQIITTVTDPKRGNELVGDNSLLGFLRLLPATIGGNPNVAPQTSTTWSAGTILTPRFIEGFRFSADWSRIAQANVYFSPLTIMGSTVPGAQQVFDDFLAAYPGRFLRSTDPSTFGAYGVGPIIRADLTTANLSKALSETIDFAAGYDHRLGTGRILMQASATWLLDLRTQATASSKPIVGTGVVDNGFLSMISVLGGVKWKGNGSLIYTTDRWSFGVRGRYVGSYWLSANHAVQPLQGSAKINAQTFIDLFGSFKINPKTEFKAGVNNVFDKSPAINATTSTFYSLYGDPRRANFYVSLSRRF